MRETTQRFELSPHLLGTFSDPPADAPRTDIGFLAFNAGTLTRVGPNRINVTICRALAAMGLPAVRFDLSGLGDSLPAPDAEAFENQAVSDLRAAMDELERRHSVRRFMILGICSGAEHAYSAALRDTRVCSVVLFDPYMYPTWRTHWNRYVARLGEHGIFRAVSGWVRRRVLQPDTAAPPTLWSDRAVPGRAEFAQGLATLLDRGVGIYLLYSGGRPDDYNYAGQFRDAFSRWGIVSRVQCDYLPRALAELTEGPLPQLRHEENIGGERHVLVRIPPEALDRLGALDYIVIFHRPNGLDEQSIALRGVERIGRDTPAEEVDHP